MCPEHLQSYLSEVQKKSEYRYNLCINYNYLILQYNILINLNSIPIITNLTYLFPIVILLLTYKR